MADAGKNSKKPDRPEGEHVIDVKRPGKSAPSPTSKPIITKSGPILKDPMVNPTEPDQDEKTLVPGGLRIEPAEEAEAPEPEVKEETKSPEPAKPEEEKPAEEAAETETEEKPSKETQKTGTDQPDKQAEAEAQAIKEAAEHQAAIQSLADSKKYYLPVNSVEKRQAKQVVILGIIISILLAAAWVDVALDAGLIHIDGVKSLTHFFSS